MAAWLASQGVLPALVAVKQVRASTALGSPAVEDRMAAPAERIDRLKLAVAKAVRVVGSRAVSLGWVEGRGGFHCSPRSPAGVRSRFSVSSVFSWGEGRFQATAWAIPVAALKQRGGQR
jgi:hypothetical protein